MKNEERKIEGDKIAKEYEQCPLFSVDGRLSCFSLRRMCNEASEKMTYDARKILYYMQKMFFKINFRKDYLCMLSSQAR